MIFATTREKNVSLRPFFPSATHRQGRVSRWGRSLSRFSLASRENQIYAAVLVAQPAPQTGSERLLSHSLLLPSDVSHGNKIRKSVVTGREASRPKML